MGRQTITIERLPNESAKAHAARVEYVVMGTERSLEKTRQRLGKSSAGYTRTLEEWSARYDWAATARWWDDQQAAAMIAEAQERYREDLADYRKRYGEAGKALFGSSVRLLARINRAVETIELSGPGALALAANGLKTAADLEALALRVEHVLRTLDDDKFSTE